MIVAVRLTPVVALAALAHAAEPDPTLAPAAGNAPTSAVEKSIGWTWLPVVALRYDTAIGVHGEAGAVVGLGQHEEREG